MAVQVENAEYKAGLNADRYCRGCGYNVRQLPEPRCPECGRAFDPADPRTTLAKPKLATWWRVRQIWLALFILLLIPTVYIGQYWWGWHVEQGVFSSGEITRNGRELIGPKWLANLLGQRQYLLWRTQVTDAGVAALEKAIPGIKIVR